MSNKRYYKDNCFTPNWIEFDLEEKQSKTQLQTETQSQAQTEKEVSLETQRRKDIDTLLRELDEIRQNIQRVAEKQQRLADLMRFYTQDYARWHRN